MQHSLIVLMRLDELRHLMLKEDNDSAVLLQDIPGVYWPLLYGRICVLLQAPESLLESLETHLNTLEGKKP